MSSMSSAAAPVRVSSLVTLASDMGCCCCLCMMRTVQDACALRLP